MLVNSCNVVWCWYFCCWPAIDSRTTTSRGCFWDRQANPSHRSDFIGRCCRWLLMDDELLDRDIVLVGESILLLFILWWLCELRLKLLRLLLSILLVIWELDRRLLLLRWWLLFIPQALSSVNISVKNPGSALIRSMLELNRFTM